MAIIEFTNNKEEGLQKVKEILRELFHNGHRDFIPITLKHVKLHDAKNHDYAHGGNPLGNFDRVAKILSLYPGLKPSDPVVVAAAYMLKQLDAALWMRAMGHEARVQKSDERWDDIAIYAILIQIIEREEQNVKGKEDNKEPDPGTN